MVIDIIGTISLASHLSRCRLPVSGRARNALRHNHIHARGIVIHVARRIPIRAGRARNAGRLPRRGLMSLRVERKRERESERVREREIVREREKNYGNDSMTYEEKMCTKAVSVVMTIRNRKTNLIGAHRAVETARRAIAVRVRVGGAVHAL